MTLLLGALLVWSIALRVWLAAEGLLADHYWDERYNVKNVRHLLITGKLEPISYYYPALSYLPQTAVLAVSQWGWRKVVPGFSWFAADDLRPGGYLVCRLLQVAYGAGSILLTFALGRRLFSPAVGLVAALILAAAPIHLRLSAFFKPDILLLFLILLTMKLGLDALESPSWKRYALAGAGVGLAMSSKLNGGAIALPIALAAVILGWRDRRHLWGLAGAGAASVGLFLLVNPYVDRYFRALARNQELYSYREADAAFVVRIGRVMREAAGFLFSPSFHGRWVGALAAAGAVLLVILLFRHRREPDRWAPWLMLFTFPFAYATVYAVATAYAKPNNFLQILPVSSLLAALLVVRCWSWVASRLPVLGRWWAPALASALLIGAVAHPAQAWVYASSTSTTWERALDHVAAALEPWEGRVAYFEEVPSRLAWRPRPLRAMVRHTPRLDAVTAEELKGVDAVVFAARGEAGSSRGRIEDVVGAQALEIRRSPFRLRGPALVVLLGGASLLSVELVEAGPALRTVEFPMVASAPGGEVVSVGVWLPRAAGAPRLRNGDVDVSLRVTQFGRRSYYLSQRVQRCAPDSAPLALELPPGAPPAGDLEISLHRWAPDCD